MPSAEPKWLVIRLEVRICSPVRLYVDNNISFLTERSHFNQEPIKLQQTAVTLPGAEQSKGARRGWPSKLIQSLI